MELADVEVAEEEREVSFDGVVGNRILAKAGMLFLDYPRTKVYTLGRLPKGEWAGGRYENSLEGISLPLEHGGRSYRYILDTGVSIIIGDRVYGISNARIGNPLNALLGGKPGAISGAVLHGAAMPELLLFPVDMPPEFKADGILGYNLLWDKELVIDFENSMFYMRRGEAASVLDM
jgi:hypothetical protein